MVGLAGRRSGEGAFLGGRVRGGCPMGSGGQGGAFLGVFGRWREGHALPPCPPTMPSHHALPPCPPTMPSHHALPPCPPTMPSHHAPPPAVGRRAQRSPRTMEAARGLRKVGRGRGLRDAEPFLPIALVHVGLRFPPGLAEILQGVGMFGSRVKEPGPVAVPRKREIVTDEIRGKLWPCEAGPVQALERVGTKRLKRLIDESFHVLT